jgi:hypothetical protein
MIFTRLPPIGLAILVFFISPFSLSAADYPASQIPSGQIRFIENKNQWDDKILYDAKIPGGDLFLEKNTFTYFVFSKDDLKKIHPMKEFPMVLHGHAWKENFSGANPDVTGNVRFAVYQLL